MNKKSKFDFLKQTRQSQDEPETNLDQKPVIESVPESVPEPPPPPKATGSKRGKSNTPPPPDPTPRKPGRPKGGKRSDPNYEQVTAYIRKDTHKAIKKQLIDDPDRDFSDLIQELLEEHLS